MRVVLLFTFIYVFYIHDYCPSSDDTVPIPVGCLIRYPEKYTDKYVQVSGKYSTIEGNWTTSSNTGNYEIKINGTIYGPSAYFGDDAPVHLPFTVVNGTNLSNLVEWNDYYWYGIFRVTDRFVLEVSKIEKVNV